MDSERSDPRLTEMCVHQVPQHKCPLCPRPDRLTAVELIKSMREKATQSFRRRTDYKESGQGEENQAHDN